MKVEPYDTAPKFMHSFIATGNDLKSVQETRSLNFQQSTGSLKTAMFSSGLGAYFWDAGGLEVNDLVSCMLPCQFALIGVFGFISSNWH